VVGGGPSEKGDVMLKKHEAGPRAEKGSRTIGGLQAKEARASRKMVSQKISKKRGGRRGSATLKRRRF